MIMERLTTDRAKKVFEALITDDYGYGALWDLIDDFECNGHTISVKGSNQHLSVIIDNCYHKIGGKCTVVDNGIIYNNPLDHVMALLAK